MRLNNKNQYAEPIAEIDWFTVKDTITTSSQDDNDEPIVLPEDMVGPFGTGTEPDY